jgi:glycosyltransferase involved in cell wall biosynthesis
MEDNVLYVTAYYEVDSFAKREELFSNFRPILNGNFCILLFTDCEDLPEEFTNNPKIKLVKVSRSDIPSFQFTDPVLPEYRNKEKDSAEFLGLMNAKTEFLRRASELVDAKAYVWFDFGILKISRNHEKFVKRLGRMSESLELYPNKVIIPGCYERSKINFSNMYAFPIWRFCGGLFIVPKVCLEELINLHNEQLDRCRILNTLTWEVNLFAAMEEKNSELFQWYLADHNDSIVESPIPQKQKRVILMSMIKNENRIIKRLIESSLPIADAICIVDTGSTDNTIEVLTDYFKDFKIPAKIFNGPEHAWKNFGHNRTQSFLAAVKYCEELGWDAEHTYALAMDADMQLVVKPAFNKNDLTSLGYKIIQSSGNLEYYNTRFLKLAHSWQCTGVTHEYWDGANSDSIGMDKIYISDIGDGGCKADKFERDVRLLEEGLKDSPNNPRYLFYLAQSYKDSGQIDKSIETYKKRIDAGGWGEEIWYSMYTIMKLYAEKKMWPEMEMWGNKAYEYRKERSENLIYLVRHFRDRRQYHKAWHYYELGAGIKKPDDLLFIETDVYDRQFDYERCIIHDYVFPHKKKESLQHSLNFYNKFHDYCMYTNIQWFVTKIPGEVRRLEFEDIGDFVATSTCMLKLHNGKYRLNVRYVNYRIQPNGSYLMMKDGNLSPDNHVRTENYTCLMDEKFNFLGPLRKMELNQKEIHDTHIKGLEDLRIFYDEAGQIRYFGTTMNYSHDGCIRQVTGLYNAEKGLLEDQKHLKQPRDSGCEKNWIPYKDGKIIYGWHPFEIGKPDDDGKLVIETKQDTPHFLTNMRGSSTLVKDGRYYYGMTHCVMYMTPRKYYHMVVKIDGETDKLVGYTLPFFFLNNAIEYVLGFDKRGDTFTAIVSQNDRDPVMIDFKNVDLTWCEL